MSKFQLGKEYPAPDEEKDIAKIITLFKKTLAGYYPTGETKRIFHPKMHGLVQAKFEVEKNLPDNFKTPLFQPGAVSTGWIRFSNAKKNPDHDKKKDMRGMAIKLVGIPGEKILEHEKAASTQDFVLVTSPTVQNRSVKEFRKSLEALMGSRLKLAFYAITHPGVLWKSLKMISKCSNLLETSFFSTTAYQYGNKDLAVKYAVLPETTQESSFPDNPPYSFLQERLIKDLAEKEYRFSFMIQVQLDPDTMPVEDPSKKWKSPYIKIATIKIPKQHFQSEEQIKYGENLAFTPWHSIPEHRPLGGVNRARKDVYIALSEMRHKRNGAEETEPDFLKTFGAAEKQDSA